MITGDWLQSLLPAGARVRALGQFATGAGNIREMVYAPGLCEERHYHSTSSLIYIVAGAHWAAHTRGGGICRPGTVRYLPAGEPHEVHFPDGSWCLEIALSESLVRLAGTHGRLWQIPGELPAAYAGALGARLHE
jgi:quercetin dioxygenase-like cupin family protein